MSAESLSPTLVYDDLVHERDRLRDARRSVTSQLGPMPAASAIVLGLFGSLGANNERLFIAALVTLIPIVAVSSFAITYMPYRRIRDREIETLTEDGWKGDEDQQVDDWLAAMIQLETAIKPKSEKAFEIERTLLLVVQWMVVIQVVLLGLMVVIGPGGEGASG